ncbi:hypothetical protein DBR11_27570 [Pedobacter sp. HMWF019]|uniref:DUF4302 domain-containing protein n=1 Tax=Pedobacter sp. HMWF019 TaxID=2056856 RepID=UPI000D36F38B|nr:DUF4302 domain-containing protein [Pedobacter sp. HMWF019]PTS92091.1 hypothetical protein DBR11_27570 [Pedobacter sp. HMWF019]
MMKKIFVISLFAILFMQACKKDQQLVDGKKPEENVSEALEKYRNELINTPNGWIAYLYTNEIGGGYSFFLDFKKDNLLTMKADYVSGSSQSTYRVKQVMAPSIIFDTYNSLHLLADPDPSKFGGETGVGYGSDFEFEIRSQVGDTIKLVGKKRQTEFILVKASAADKSFYTEGGLEGLQAYLKANPNLYILDEKDQTKKIQLDINADVASRSVSLTLEDKGVITSVSQPFSFSPTGLLNKPLNFGGNIYTHFTWDMESKKLFWITTSGKKVEVFVSDKPLIPLHVLIGSKYNSITAPYQTSYPGWSADFQARRAQAARSILTGGYNLTLREMEFGFNAETKKLVITMSIPQGTTQFYAFFGYNYTKTAEGVYRFTIDPTYVAPNTNGSLIITGLAPILAQRFNVDQFTLDYFVNPANGQLLGQFKSVEHPDFTFSGPLQ